MNTVIRLVLFVVTAILVLAGCQTAPMTARSKLDRDGDAVVVQRTTTITVGHDGKTSTNIVEVATTKTPAAGDLEVKNNELGYRRDVGVARAGLWNWFWTPAYGAGVPYYADGDRSYLGRFPQGGCPPTPQVIGR